MTTDHPTDCLTFAHLSPPGCTRVSPRAWWTATRHPPCEWAREKPLISPHAKVPASRSEGTDVWCYTKQGSEGWARDKTGVLMGCRKRFAEAIFGKHRSGCDCRLANAIPRGTRIVPIQYPRVRPRAGSEALRGPRGSRTYESDEVVSMYVIHFLTQRFVVKSADV
jgi:hypothetical protein